MDRQLFVITKIRVIAAGVLAIGIGGAFLVPSSAIGATVQFVVLGGVNNATKRTTITDTGGTPLALDGPTTSPPLAVNSRRTVSRLSSDLLDGLDSKVFARVAGKTEVVTSKAGEAAACPDGTILTGGGGKTSDKDGLKISGPGEANTWKATDGSDPDQTVSFAVCYDPTGTLIS